MPKPVLKFVDATRGVLFSLSQIYAAIAQYTAVCTDERLVAHFQRVLGIANKAMSVLIGAPVSYTHLTLPTKRIV